jgi:rhodanese-related sulfurtransferase
MVPLEIDVRTVKQMLDRGEKFVFLDCREADEVATAKVAGTIHIPMREIPARIGELEANKSDRIVVHCHHGGRSLRVTHFLRQQGFEQAQNMAGGIDAWSQEIDPAVPRYE